MREEENLVIIDPKTNLPSEEKTSITPWAPDLKKVLQVRNMILKAYESSPGVYDLNNSKKKLKIPMRFLHQYAKIVVYLQEKNQFIKQLYKLNRLLIEEAAKTPSSTSKVLRRVLERELAKFGFQPHMGKAHDFLPDSMFRETLRHGMILKDPGLRNDFHGDFTHAIQWVMIAWQHQESQFLGGSAEEADRLVVNIYKSLGQDTAVISNEKLDISDLSSSGYTMWDFLVDQPPSTYTQKRHILQDEWKKDPYGFCSPENLHIFLFKNTIPELDFLRKLILKRETKRNEEALDQKRQPLFNELELKNPLYFFHSPYPLQLPATELQDKNNSLRELALKVSTGDSDEKGVFPPPIEPKNSFQSYLDAEESFEAEEYEKTIKLLLRIEKFYTQKYPKSTALQNIFYYLGFSYRMKKDLTRADYYLRKALQVALDPAKANHKTDIPLATIMSELSIIQHISRVKAQAEKNQEDTTQCIIS